MNTKPEKTKRFYLPLALSLLLVASSVFAGQCGHRHSEKTGMENASAHAAAASMPANLKMEANHCLDKDMPNTATEMDSSNCCESGSCSMAACSISGLPQSPGLELPVYNALTLDINRQAFYLQPESSSLYRPPIQTPGT